MCKKISQYVSEKNDLYSFKRSVSKKEIVDLALNLQYKGFKDNPLMTNPSDVKNYLQNLLSEKKKEIFAVMFLTSKHHLIECVELFEGTINSASVPIRELVVEVLERNAAAIIIAHNHPSGSAEASIADQNLTESISTAMTLIGVKLLDHIIIGDGETLSFAEEGRIF